MPPRRRRTGYRPGRQLPPELQRAVEREVARLEAIEDDFEVIAEVGALMSAWDDALEDVGGPRLRAIGRLRALGWSYDRLADATGLSKARIAQLAREAQRRRLQG